MQTARHACAETDGYLKLFMTLNAFAYKSVSFYREKQQTLSFKVNTVILSREGVIHTYAGPFDFANGSRSITFPSSSLHLQEFTFLHVPWAVTRQPSFNKVNKTRVFFMANGCYTYMYPEVFIITQLIEC